MRMKTLPILLFGAMVFGSLIYGQSDSIKLRADQKFNHFSFGMQLVRYQNDFGTGLHATSPFIINRIAFRLRGNLQFYEPTWSPYGNVTLSMVARQTVIPGKIFVYGEGGGGIIIPNSSVSVDPVYGAGFGLFGVEFTPRPFGFYFEMGGMGTAARDVFNRSYSNGFIIHTGFRVYL